MPIHSTGFASIETVQERGPHGSSRSAANQRALNPAESQLEKGGDRLPRLQFVSLGFLGASPVPIGP